MPTAHRRSGPRSSIRLLNLLLAVALAVPALARAGIFVAPLEIPTTAPERPLAWDYDRDGRPDLVVSRNSSVASGFAIWNNTPSGWVQAADINVGNALGKRFMLTVGDAGNYDLFYTALNVATQVCSVGKLGNLGNNVFVDQPDQFVGLGGTCWPLFGPVRIHTSQPDGYKLIVGADLRQKPGHTADGGIYYLPLLHDAAPLFEATPYAVNALVSADFNKDGLPDLAYDGIDSSPSPGIHHLVVLLRTAGGSWTSGSNQVVEPCYGQDFFAIDLNGDTYPDLALQAGNDVGVLLNNGSGGFGSETIVPTPAGHGVMSNVFGDLNGDGRPDLVQLGYVPGAGVNFASIGFSVRLNNGAGGFGAPTYYPIALEYSISGSGFVIAGAMADFDHDGRTDLAVSILDGNRLLFFSGRGDGTFAPPVLNIALGGDAANTVVLGDLDADGRRDIGIGFDSPTAAVGVLRSLGEGSFDPMMGLAAGTTVTRLAVGDATGDGLSDLVLGRGANAPGFIAADGLGGFQPAMYLDPLDDGSGTARISGIAALDMDQAPDQVAEIICAPETSSPFHLEIRAGDGLGGHTLHQDYGLDGASQGVVMRDETNDGIADIVTFTTGSSTATPGAAVVLPAFAGSAVPGSPIESPMSFAPTPDSPHPFAIIPGGPSTRSGDMVVLDDSQALVHVLHTHLDGTFTEVASYAIPDIGAAVAVGDLDHDGRTDIAVVCTGDASVNILAGTAGGTFLPNERYPVARPVDLQIADMTGDNIDDLVVLTSLLPALANASGPSSAQAVGASGVARAQTTRSALFEFPGHGAAVQTTAVPWPGPAPPGAGVALTASPNPGWSGTHLDFALPTAGRVRLAIFDVRGRLVSTLADADMPAGAHRLEWSGRGAGGEVAAGVYFARLVTATGTRVQRVVRVR
jgi:hypothetical protein